MATMNVSLPDEMKAYVDSRVVESSYQTSSEYVRDLIRRDQEISRFQALIREGIESGVEGPVDEAWFDSMRARIRS